MYLFFAITALINGLVALATGAVVYFKNKKNLINQTFAIFCFAIAFWALGSFWPLVTDDPELSLVSFRVLHVGAFFLAIANFHFICSILGIVDKQKRFIQVGYAASSLFLLAIPTSLFISGVVPKHNLSLWADVGILYHIWLAIWFAYFAYSFFLLNQHYKRSTGVRHQQIKYILMGEIVTFGVLAINFLPAYDVNVPLYFNILLTAQVIAFAYAILRYHFLDVQLSILNIVKKISALVLALGFGLLISYVVFFRKEEASVLMLFPIISLITYFSLSSFFNSHLFYHLLRINHIDDFTKAIDNFYEKKLFYTSMAELKQSVQETFEKDLGIKPAEIVLLTPGNRQRFRDLIRHFRKDEHEHLALREFFSKLQGVNEIRAMGELCFPLWGRENKLTGFFFLGKKRHQALYTKKEIQVLKSAASHIRLSMRVLHYNRDLHEEVDRKTKQIRQFTLKLRDSYKKLKELDAAKDLFFSVTSHDLRTPLTIIKGYDDFLLSGKFGSLTKKQREFLERIYKSTDSVLHLVNSLLDISRLDANRMQFNFEKVDVEKAISDIAADFRVKCAEKSIKFNVENPEKIKSTIVTDAEKFKRILMNLAGNAFKFTPEKGSITLRVRKNPKDDQALQFEIQDTGVGIAKKDREAIFERFRQVQNSFQSQHKGTGLGLSIVKGIVKKLGGQIWVESTPGKGSNFIFTHPLKNKLSQSKKSA